MLIASNIFMTPTSLQFKDGKEANQSASVIPELGLLHNLLTLFVLLSGEIKVALLRNLTFAASSSSMLRLTAWFYVSFLVSDLNCATCCSHDVLGHCFHGCSRRLSRSRACGYDSDRASPARHCYIFCKRQCAHI